MKNAYHRLENAKKRQYQSIIAIIYANLRQISFVIFEIPLNAIILSDI